MIDTDLRHRLAAILAADAAGYSRLMAGDDRATVVVVFRHYLAGLRNAGRTG